MKWITSLQERIEDIREDDRSQQILRYAVLFMLFLALTLAMFFGLRQWHAPDLPPEGKATTAQHGVYTVGAGMLVAGVVTAAVAAFDEEKKNKQRPLWFCPLLAGGLGLALFILGYAFLGVWPLGDKTVMMVDMHHQYAPLLSELRNMILHGGNASYNFHMGMGSSFIPAFAYYLSSPLNILLLFFSERYLAQAILVITLLKGAAAAASFTTMAQYLCHRRTSSMVAVGVLYALSGYMLAYSWNIMWLDVVALLPVVVLAMEHMLRTGKVVPYALLLALALFANYYIGFMLCIFLVLYMVVWVLREPRTLRETAVGGLRFAAGSLWGGALAACLLIPTALALGRTSAAGGEMIEFNTNFPFFDLLGRLFYGATPTIRSGNLPNLYCGVVAVLLAPVYLSQKTIPLRRRLCYGGLLGVLLFSCTLKQWDLLWHGLHAPNDLPYRFSFLIAFVLLLMAAQALSEMEKVTPRQILISLLGCAGYLFLWEKLGELTTAATPDTAEKVTTSAALLYGNVALLVIYAVILLVRAVKKAPTAVTSRLLLAAVCMELVLGVPLTLTEMNANEYYTRHEDYIYDYEHTVTDAALRRAEEIAAAEADTEGVFLRMEYLPRHTCVDTALHHYNGLTTFASSNPYLTTKLMGQLGYAVNGVNSYLYRSFVAAPDSLLGLRYVVLKVNLSSHPQLEKVDSIAMRDPATGEEHVRYIYRNKLALPIAYAASSAVLEYEGTDYAPFQSQQDLYESLSGRTDVIYEPMKITADNGATITGSGFHQKAAGTARYTATVTTAGQYFAYVDCRAAEKILVEQRKTDGNLSNSWSVTTHEPYIIDVGTLQPGASIEVEVDSDTACSGNIHLVRLNTAALNSHISALETGGMLITEQTGRSITGTVVAQNNQTLFFALPYDKGWSVYVDGSPVETFPIAKDDTVEMDEDGNVIEEAAEDGAFLGAAIHAGTHTVTAVYRAPGQTLGLLITLAAALLLLIPGYRWWMSRKAGRTILVAVKDENASAESEDVPTEEV